MSELSNEQKSKRVEARNSIDRRKDGSQKVSENSAVLADRIDNVRKEFGPLSSIVGWLKREIARINPAMELLNQKINYLMGAITKVEANSRKLACWLAFHGEHTTVGTAASEDIAIAGVRASHNCMVEIKTVGATPVTVLSSSCGDGAITVVFSADPSDDHVIKYIVY